MPETAGVTLALGLFARWFSAASWDNWRAFLGSVFVIPLTPEQLATYRQCTGRARPPTRQPREAYAICGRRAGKSLIAALVAVTVAVFRSHRGVLQPGERGVVMVLAADRRQAGVILRFVQSFFTVPELDELVVRRTREGITLVNDEREISIEVHTANFRAVRGYTLLGCIADELAFWPADDSASPDLETLAAVRPAMASVPNALLLCISSPYARRGALWEAYSKHYGREDAPMLVWKAPSLLMNPTLDPAIVEAAFEADPASADAEYEANFRSDVAALLSRDRIEALVVPGRHELPPVAGTEYSPFADPAGGRRHGQLHVGGGPPRGRADRARSAARSAPAVLA